VVSEEGDELGLAGGKEDCWRQLPCAWLWRLFIPHCGCCCQNNALSLASQLAEGTNQVGAGRLLHFP